MLVGVVIQDMCDVLQMVYQALSVPQGKKGVWETSWEGMHSI
jgi:hypothetical protein